MFHAFRFAFSMMAVFGVISGALAAGSSVPSDYVPDPALKKISVKQLQARVANACVVIQTQDQLTNNDPIITKKCACYARATIQSLSPEELTEYRNTGVFNSSARNKGYAALKYCGLPKP